MTISSDILESLKNNWGIKADALACYCEVKFIDPISGWSCYILAIDPLNPDNIRCFIPTETPPICDWSMQALLSSYNKYGEPLEIDTEYRKINAAVLYRKLK